MRRGVFPAALLIALPALGAVDFQKQVAPVFEANCVSCHGIAKGLAGVRVDVKLKNPDRVLAVMDLEPGKPGAMPPGGPQVPKAQRDLIRQWVAEGAPWPDGFTIRANKAGQSEASERAAVSKLHAKIAAQPAAAKMEPYKTTIPGTDISF